MRGTLLDLEIEPFRGMLRAIECVYEGSLLVSIDSMSREADLLFIRWPRLEHTSRFSKSIRRPMFLSTWPLVRTGQV
jgi:hypothetical protein